MVTEVETLREKTDLPLVVSVRNTGTRDGREVLQVYLEPPDTDPSRPLRTLAAFSAVEAAAGERVEAQLSIPARAFARFDPELRGWIWDPGTYTVHVGRSSRDLRLSVPMELRGGVRSAE